MFILYLLISKWIDDIQILIPTPRSQYKHKN